MLLRGEALPLDVLSDLLLAALGFVRAMFLTHMMKNHRHPPFKFSLTTYQGALLLSR